MAPKAGGPGPPTAAAGSGLGARPYSADDFIRYDLTDDLLDYLVAAFDVLEIIDVGHRRLRVENAVTVESFDLVARPDPGDPTLVIPVLVAIWLWEPEDPADSSN